MFNLKKLPYENLALEPVISSKTLEFHHGKHHQAYVDNLNKFIEGTDFAGRKLEDIIKASYGNAELLAIYNNTGQVFNHDFYFSSISPELTEPSGIFAEMINKSFGSLAEMSLKMKEVGMSQFGSGWVWLVEKDAKLEIVKTANADSPLTMGLKPLLVIDVWEHAYYLDYQNRRVDYLTEVIKHLNWKVAESRLHD